MAIIRCYGCFGVETVLHLQVHFLVRSQPSASACHSDRSLSLCVTCCVVTLMNKRATACRTSPGYRTANRRHLHTPVLSVYHLLTLGARKSVPMSVNKAQKYAQTRGCGCSVHTKQFPYLQAVSKLRLYQNM
jgi:hypothetical protein